MPDKEKNHINRESAVDEQIEKSIRALNKELGALKGKTDTASAEKTERLKLQIKNLKVARSLPRMQKEDATPETSVQESRSLARSALEGVERRCGYLGRPKVPRVPPVDSDGESHLPETVGGIWELKKLSKKKPKS